MKDELEDFIHQHRSDFDDKQPPTKVWDAVERELPQSKQRFLWTSVSLWRTAAIIFMVLSVYLLLPKHSAKTQIQDIGGKDFNDVEAFYVEQISEKVALIEAFKHNEELNGYTHNFKQLEAMYFVLKEEMRNHPSQKVKDALVLNLLVRIDLLNEQLHSLEEEKHTKIERDV